MRDDVVDVMTLTIYSAVELMVVEESVVVGWDGGREREGRRRRREAARRAREAWEGGSGWWRGLRAAARSRKEAMMASSSGDSTPRARSVLSVP